MLRRLHSRLRQLVHDPVLRRWLLARLFRRVEAGETGLNHRRPDWLAGIEPVESSAGTGAAWQEIAGGVPGTPLTLDVLAMRTMVPPDDAGALFRLDDGDLETRLYLHRFAWVDQLGDADAVWFRVLWEAWKADWLDSDDSWVWHPYTAAERAINLMRAATRFGAPEAAAAFADCLAAHAPRIAARFEYAGEVQTSNHFANNGRGLYLVGQACNMPNAAETGYEILAHEGARLFRPSGFLREGSTHYHLLVCANYLDCYIAARDAGREDEAKKLLAICRKPAAVAMELLSAGHLPLIGDISPDETPEMTAKRIARFRDTAPEVFERACDARLLLRDGLMHRAFGDFEGFWHAAPGGWPPMPGHGHQDAGSFDMCWRGQPLFVDPGRGAYGEDGDSALYRSARRHSSLTLDGHDPYPPNRPYYDDAFRYRVCGPAPILQAGSDVAEIRFSGYVRFSGLNEVMRRWEFSDKGFRLVDRVAGHRETAIMRRFVTPWPVRLEAGAAIISHPQGDIRLAPAEGDIMVTPVEIWRAYGRSETGRCIEIACRGKLPWTGIVEVHPA
jgi:hypothetical protein